MTDAKQAARELAELMLMESAVITASDIPWLDEMFAQALEAFAAERVREERERWAAIGSELHRDAQDAIDSGTLQDGYDEIFKEGFAAGVACLVSKAIQQPNEARA